MSRIAESMVTFIEDAIPEVTITEIDGWDESDRGIDSLFAVLVKLGPRVAEMSYEEFCNAIMDSGEASLFDQLVEVYERDDGDAVYRVTGDRVDDGPRYFLDSTSAILVLHGAYSRDNVAVALYEPDAFDESAHRYIDSYRLFSEDNRENRAERIRHSNAIIDRITANAVTDEIDELREDSNGGLDGYFDEFSDDRDRSNNR